MQAQVTQRNGLHLFLHLALYHRFSLIAELYCRDSSHQSVMATTLVSKVFLHGCLQ
jgi:hypothetical protein